MKRGDLVKTKRASIGVPVDTVGLIVDVFMSPSHRVPVYVLVLMGTRHHPAISRRRYIGTDLKAINESR